MTHSVRNKLMLVGLNISMWTARKADKRVTEDVAIRNNADIRHAGRYNKQLIAKSGIEEVVTAAGAARLLHYKQTLPWTDEGYRVLPAANYFDYINSISQAESEFNLAVSRFLQSYPTLRDQARLVLGDLYNEADYPSVDKLESRFGFQMNVMPMPDGSDFRADIGDEEVQIISKDITERVEAAQREAIKDCYRRIAESVGNMHQRLSDPEAKFRDSLVNNLKELVQVLPKLNFTDDAELNGIIEDMNAKLCGVSPQMLRSSKQVRANVAAAAGSLLDRVSKWT